MHNGIQGTIQMLNWIDAKHGDLKAAMRADDEHDAMLENNNPFMTNPVDDLGMPVARQPSPIPLGVRSTVTVPRYDPTIQFAGELPTADTADADNPDDADYDEEAESHAPQPPPHQADPDLSRDPGPVTEKNNPDYFPGGPKAFQHLPFDPSSQSEPLRDPWDPQRGTLPPQMRDKPRPIPGARDPAQTYPPGTRTLAQPIQTAQADTGTATDAPSPAESAAAPGADIYVRSAVGTKRREAREAAQKAAAAQPAPAAPAADEIPDTPTLRDAQKQGYDTGFINDLGQQLITGQISAASLGRDVKGPARELALRRAAEIRNELRRILSDPNIKKGDAEAVFSAVEKQSKTLADDMRAIKAGAGGPPKKDDPMFRALMFKADPTFTDLSYKARAGAIDFYTKGRGADNVIRIGTSYKHINEALSAMDDLPSKLRQALEAGLLIPRSWIDALGPEGGAQIARAEQALHTVAAEVNQTLAYNRGAAFERRDLTDQLNVYNYPATTRRLRELQTLVAGRQKELQEDFDAKTSMDFNKIRRNISGMNPDAAQGLSEMDQRGKDPNHPITLEELMR
jgi:hypothetical protein